METLKEILPKKKKLDYGIVTCSSYSTGAPNLQYISVPCKIYIDLAGQRNLHVYNCFEDNCIMIAAPFWNDIHIEHKPNNIKHSFLTHPTS